MKGIKPYIPCRIRSVAGSNRGVRRALIHRNRRYAGVTAGDGVIIPFMSQDPTVRPRPLGSEVLLETTGGLFTFSFASENGPGPEGSSPTVDYRCSMGSGVEKVLGVLTNVMSANLGDPAFYLLLAQITTPKSVIAPPTIVKAGGISCSIKNARSEAPTGSARRLVDTNLALTYFKAQL